MSKDVIKKFLDGTKEFADTTEVKIGDQVVTLGDLRALSADERKSVNDKMAELAATEKDLKERQSKVVELAAAAQKIYDNEAARAAAAAGSGGGDKGKGTNPLDDPWYAPIKAELEARDKKYTELTESIKKLGETVASAIAVNTRRGWDNEFSSISASPAYKGRQTKPTLQELLVYAQTNKTNDAYGLPSVSAAWEHMTAGEREAERIKEAEERGRELGRQESVAARVLPPGAPGAGVMPPVKVKPGEADLGDLYTEASKDPDLRQLLEQAQSAGIM